MENQNIEFRAVIKALINEGVNANEIHRFMAWQPKVFLSGKVKPVRDSFEDGPKP